MTCLEKILKELEKMTFSAELYGGEEVDNLLCLGDVAFVLEKYMDKENERTPVEETRKEMTVEELVKVLDKNSRFVIRVCHTDKALYNPLKDEEKWEIFRKKEVVQFTPVGDGIIIYVAPPVGKDS